MTTQSTVPADLTLTAWDWDELDAAEDRAARTYAAYTLHAFLPTEQQGDMSMGAFVERKARADEARDLWLAVQAERARRRQDAPLRRVH